MAEVGADEGGSLGRQARTGPENEAVDQVVPSLKMGEEDEDQATSVKARQNETEDEAVGGPVAAIHNIVDGEDAVAVNLELAVVTVPLVAAMVAVVMALVEAKAVAAVEDPGRVR